MTIRIQKQLADAGYGSRRQVETWIEAGRLQINGELARLGSKVSLADVITLDGKVLAFHETKTQPCRVIMYHKPEGQICTRHDPGERDTIFEHLPKLKHARWISVGRLDVNTSGLLLLTTHGELANRLMHPKHEIVREYAVRILGELTPSQIRQLTKGVMLEDGEASFGTVTPKGGEGVNHWYHVTLAEGRNREVRRMFAALDLQVSRLIRIRYGDITLPKYLSRGKCSDLLPTQITLLAKSVELEVTPYARVRQSRTPDAHVFKSASPDKRRGAAKQMSAEPRQAKYRRQDSDAHVFKSASPDKRRGAAKQMSAEPRQAKYRRQDSEGAFKSSKTRASSSYSAKAKPTKTLSGPAPRKPRRPL